MGGCAKGATPLFRLCNRKENILRKTHSRYRYKTKKYNKNKNQSKYGKFACTNKAVRESPIAPSAFSKIENRGFIGKVVSIIGEKLIEKPLHEMTYGVVGTIYNKKKHSAYLGSILYTVFNWILKLIFAACAPLLFIMTMIGLGEKLKKD